MKGSVVPPAAVVAMSLAGLSTLSVRLQLSGVLMGKQPKSLVLSDMGCPHSSAARAGHYFARPNFEGHLPNRKNHPRLAANFAPAIEGAIAG